ncbi:MAG: response regulator [Bacteriovoracaceae bacterium]|nr:response regulator [Bacteriovoracaceae bacterium]
MSGANVKILVVDDERSMRKLLSIILKRDNCVIKTAANVSQAKEIIEFEAQHIVISDIKMPGEDGLSLLRWIKSNYRQTYVIIISGHSEDNVLSQGAAVYLKKPFNNQKIVTIVNDYIHQLHLKNKVK